MFAFVMKYENIEFVESLKILAEKAGIQLQYSAGAGDANKNIYDAVALAKDFFVDNLWKVQSAHRTIAINYLKERGLAEATIREFEIGLAPTSSDSLMRHLIAKKKSIQDIEKAGLVFKSERGTYWDRFRSRLMFPLYNNQGKVVGFTGRVSPNVVGESGYDAAKYVNSPETPIFNKSKVLYGFHKSKSSIRDSKTAIIVEGQMDFLMMWQDGIKNVIASSGTALTHEHLETLRKISDNLILSFDSDEAGLLAAERSIDLANSLDFNVKVLEIKDYKDPADAVLASPGTMAELVSLALPAMRHYFNRYLKSGTDISVKKKNIRIVLGKIRNISSSIERSHFLRELSLETNIPETALMEEMQSIKSDHAPVFRAVSGPSPIPQKAKQLRKDAISENILSILVKDSSFRPDIELCKEFFSPRYKLIFESFDVGGFSNISDDIRESVDLISLRSGLDDPGGEKEVKVNLKRLLKELKSESLKSRLLEIKLDIGKFEREGDEDGLKKALKEFDSMSKDLHNV